MYYIITFPSTYQALNFEDMYKSTALEFTLMPVPREISSSCGIAVRLKNIDKGMFLQTVAKAQEKGIEVEKLYSMQVEGKKHKIEKIDQQ